MKFFTAELLEQMNRGDGESFLAAHNAWDKNEARYKQHLATLESKLPDPAWQLAKACYHDAQVLTISYNDSSKLSIILRVGKLLHVLTFELAGSSIMTEPESRPNFASDGLLWLYEEWDFRRGRNILRVLLSNGSELEIPFSNVSLEKLRVQTQSSRSSSLDRLTPAFSFTTPAAGNVVHRMIYKTAPRT